MPAYRYLDNHDEPLQKCPSCNTVLTNPDSVELELNCAGAVVTTLTCLTKSGQLVDTDDKAVAKGFHSETRCRQCGISLIDHEEEDDG